MNGAVCLEGVPMAVSWLWSFAPHTRGRRKGYNAPAGFRQPAAAPPPRQAQKWSTGPWPLPIR